MQSISTQLSLLSLLSADQMQAVDAKATVQGINSHKLMQNAGDAVAQAVVNLSSSRPCRILVLAGPGNNGGDGAVAATKLQSLGYTVTCIRAGSKPGSSSDAGLAWQEWQGKTIEARVENDALDVPVLELIEGTDIVVDALFGAGLSRPLQGVFAQLLKYTNLCTARVVSIDVPSGLNGNTHTAYDDCVQADVTVSFFRAKPAHYLYPGRALCGQFMFQQIGLTDKLINPLNPACYLNALPVFENHLPALKATAHKFERGHVLVRSGPAHATGAARLSADTALRCGAGLVTMASDRDALTVNAIHLTAVMLRICNNPDDWQALLTDTRFTTAVIGPGNGVDSATKACVLGALAADRHCVLDADALSCWPDDTDKNKLTSALINCKRTPVLTPHAGEFERLFGHLDKDALPSKLHQARAAATLTHSIIVYKGADTVIAAPDGRSCINANAPPWLATAGAGDVLAGAIASLICQGMPAFEAACAAVWLHGKAAQSLGYPICAEQLVNQIPHELGLISPQNKHSDPS